MQLPTLSLSIRFAIVVVFIGLFNILVAQKSQAQDKVEFMNGTTMEGKIKEIRPDDEQFDFETKIGNQSLTRTYPYAKVHAVTYNGKRFVLTEMKDTTDQSKATETKTAGKEKSEAEIRKIIDEVGSTPPDWLDSEPMNHPRSLDLDWPLKVEGPWNESKNIGQYIWGRVNPNTSRWKSGIKLVHECLRRHQGDRELMQRDMQKLGVMYFQLLQDYPRAAFWLEKSNADPSQGPGIHLAECYYRLGSKSMAMKMLRGNRLNIGAIKLYAEMGELDRALSLTKAFERTSLFNEAYLSAGDALRNEGQYEKALAYYQKILDTNRARNDEYLNRFKGRANDAITAIKLFETLDVSNVANGTYNASATGYNGQLHVAVKVQDGRIEDVSITRHNEKQYYAALTDTPNQIIKTQGVTKIDGTSGATITSQAIVAATAKALADGAK